MPKSRIEAILLLKHEEMQLDTSKLQIGIHTAVTALYGERSIVPNSIRTSELSKASDKASDKAPRKAPRKAADESSGKGVETLDALLAVVQAKAAPLVGRARYVLVDSSDGLGEGRRVAVREAGGAVRELEGEEKLRVLKKCFAGGVSK